MKIVILDGYSLNPGDLSWGPLEALGELTVYDRTPPEWVRERIGDAPIVFTNKTILTRELLEDCPNLKYVGVLATGMNVLDGSYAESLGIVVNNVPDYSTDSVAQLTIALLLELCHRVGEHHLSVKRGDWSQSQDFCYWNFPLIELAGKTMGLIGVGKIGQRTEVIAKALGMKVLKTSRSMGEGCISLEQVLRESDVISLHCPLTPETEGMINRETLGLMKDGVILINTARGPLIVEQDLADALKSGKVYGAALDVVSKEPIEAENPLLGAPNCLITPHLGWAPKEARIRLLNIAASRLENFIKQNSSV